MRTLHARKMTPRAVADAAAVVARRGGIVIFPTDTVYGIGCDPASATAVARVFALKGRPAHKPLSLHLASVDQLITYAGNGELVRRIAGAFLPGALTLIVRRPPSVGGYVTAGLDTVGLRVPKHALCAAILQRCGPLAATSANFSGRPAFAGTVKEPLPEADLAIDDGPTPVGVESTIIDVSMEDVRLVREGAISRAMLERELGEIVFGHDERDHRA
ncbi:MAG: threonylcarbamoyl-AMP synthase [Candidatus Eremiobacteraeota bacterium]|nr:threonylcarbamoyl-AMP synthase [Candidatus Eremiobacteraeota bacterium]MBC5802873.1 threonylcarbamoyl-AMP synthase [Candidatus Eremiobacteraeota bacterium]MBC5821528.1 threonylcarbamoyl-AMP synthase [Candidatus Eremiobacteraeota bacterium]